MREFADRLRVVRRSMGLNQADFAALGGVVMNSQNQYEAAATEPKATYLLNLAAHGVDVGFILTGRRSPDSLPVEVIALATVIGELPSSVRAPMGAALKMLGDVLQHPEELETDVRSLHETLLEYRGPDRR
ncbi:helix-turn-helix domain-containing protein [Sphingomonas canadensis]|uniref:Helix-turn-helix domain-containing protein n=1 Tax=Sphingomonas canadensis TaxID=1219257 RepID=A0ABW3HAR8_9SPHN|nr:hypothetical protein [Sphingomonas canadensis]